MKKKRILRLITLLLLVLIAPLGAVAKDNNKELILTDNLHKNVEIEFKNGKNNSYILNNGSLRIGKILTYKKDTDDWLDDYNKPQDCTGRNAILGSYDDEDSVAWLLQKIFNYIKILGPLIVIVMSGIDFAKVIVMGDDEGLKKAQTKLIIRLILAASLFVLPDLVSSLLELFNITSSGICGLE